MHQHLIGRALFHQMPLFHHHHPVGNLGNDTKSWVMNMTLMPFRFWILRMRSRICACVVHVERRWSAHPRSARPDRAPAPWRSSPAGAPAGEPERILQPHQRRSGRPTPFQQRQHLGLAAFGRAMAMGLQHFRNLVTDRHQRFERRQRSRKMIDTARPRSGRMASSRAARNVHAPEMDFARADFDDGRQKAMIVFAVTDLPEPDSPMMQRSHRHGDRRKYP